MSWLGFCQLGTNSCKGSVKYNQRRRVLCKCVIVEDDITGVICEEENALTKLISGQVCGAFS